MLSSRLLSTSLSTCLKFKVLLKPSILLQAHPRSLISFTLRRKPTLNKDHHHPYYYYCLSTRSCVAMAEGEVVKEPEWREYLGQEEAAEFDNSLFFEYEFSIDQLMELAGLCVAQAVARVYPLVGVASGRVLVACGPGNNGGDGLAAARHLLMFGYEPIIFYPKRTSKEIYQLLVNQCEKLNIAFIDELPSQADIDRDYHVAVDAIFGFNFKGAIRPPFERVLSTLRSVSIPIASVDIPSGWDVEKGNVRGDGLNPDLLISLSAPKLCAQHFKGRHHYLGLRIIPKELADKYRIKLPTYPSTDQIVKLK